MALFHPVVFGIHTLQGSFSREREKKDLPKGFAGPGLKKKKKCHGDVTFSPITLVRIHTRCQLRCLGERAAGK